MSDVRSSKAGLNGNPSIQARAGRKRLAERDWKYHEREGIDPFGEPELSAPGSTHPPDATYVAGIEVSFGVDTIDEDYYIVELPGERYELWRWRLGSENVVARLSIREGDLRNAARQLLERVCLVSAAFVGFGNLVQPGLVDEAGWRSILAKIDNETAAVDRADPHGLIHLADELSLMPKPVPGHAPFFQANCPRGHHWIYINADTGSWGCGYCRRKGGAKELRSFVARRGRSAR